MSEKSIAERLADSRAGVNVDDWSHYERAALVELERHGYDRVSEAGGAWQESTTKRYEIWLSESIVWTIGEIRQGNHREALRGLLQIAQYHGILGRWPTCSHADCYTCLRNHFEWVLLKA